MCTGFLYEFLQYVEREMSSIDCLDTVFTFQYNAKQNTFKCESLKGQSDRTFINRSVLVQFLKDLFFFESPILSQTPRLWVIYFNILVDNLSQNQSSDHPGLALYKKIFLNSSQVSNYKMEKRAKLSNKYNYRK